MDSQRSRSLRPRRRRNHESSHHERAAQLGHVHQLQPVSRHDGSESCGRHNHPNQRTATRRICDGLRRRNQYHSHGKTQNHGDFVPHLCVLLHHAGRKIPRNALRWGRRPRHLPKILGLQLRIQEPQHCFFRRRH